MAVFSAATAEVSFSSLDLTVRVAAAAAFCLGVLVLVGWQFDVSLLKSGVPGQSATQPMTAVCFCLCAISLGLSGASRGIYRSLMTLCAVIPLGVVILTLWQNALDTDWGLDRVLFPDAVVHEQPGQFLRPGRTAGATLLAIVMLSSCLLLSRERTRAANRLYVALATVGMLFSATVVLAYAFSLKVLYAMGLYAHVSLNSGITLGTLFAGVLLLRPELGWMRVLSSDTVGGESGRRLLKWSGSLLVVLAVIVQVCTSNSLYGAELEATLVTLAAVGLLFAGIVSHAERLNSVDVARRSAANKLRLVEEELAHSVRAKDAFLAVLAHELRNPLASLRNGVEIVRRSSGTDRTLEQTAAMMGRQMNQLVRLIDDLLDLSRITQGTIELQRERVGLKDVVDRAIEVCRDSISVRAHTLSVAPIDESAAVDGDLRRLVQIVANVLSNSVQYTEPGGRISITVANEGEQISIGVSDSGVGIPPEALEHAFEIFSQVRATRAHSDGGLGVGLALVRSLVHLHGGTVTAHNMGAGSGSTVIIRLPTADAKQSARKSTVSRDPVSLARLRILIADDNTDAASSLAMLLRLEGHEVVTAVDGLQAVTAAQQFLPDIIFMDIGMPRLDGIEATRRIRGQPWGRQMRIVALTGWGFEAERSRTEAAGMNAHLLKPVDPRELLAILKSPRTR